MTATPHIPHLATTQQPKKLGALRLRQVVDGMARGLSNPEISRELGISVETVKTYARRLLRVLDAPDRANAVVKAAAKGWINPADYTTVTRRDAA